MKMSQGLSHDFTARAVSAGVDQATKLREWARRRQTNITTIAVTSGKGGVGKSNIAVNLSVCLSSNGLRTTLVDADMGLANADLLMNLAPRYTLSHVVSGRRNIADIAVEGPGGVRFIPGASGMGDLADLTEFERRRLITQLRSLEDSADIIVLDCGAGISRSVMSFAMAADQVLVVTTPQPPALTDAYATIKSLYREGCKAHVGMLINMVNSRDEALATFDRMASVTRRFLKYTLAYRGYLLQDTSVELAVRQRCPFVLRYPRSNAAACIAAVATDVSKAIIGQRRRGSFFSRIAGVFA